MRFLIDMCLSPRAAQYLRDIGHEATHLYERGLHKLPDRDIFSLARREEAVLLTHDLDFADLVAASGERLPSVVIFRLRSMNPDNVNHHLGLLLDAHSERLRQGAVVSLTERRVRVRSLPLRKDPSSDREGDS